MDTVFLRLAAEDISDLGLHEESGWEMSFPSGKTVARSTLQAEAQPIIVLGADAVPYLLPRVMDENLPLRYVAIYALEQITGEKFRASYFDRDDREGYRAKSIEIWQGWYESQQKQH
ncbi:hypothetical protein NJ959_11465 [Symplocastrum sp. BBK-W-15]|uniref:Uncharacterized protein n=2 Tax=Limnofasciculus TaxID=3064905 RepID=A0AAE3KM13_9CYAN|nr:hypothetical protein [Limnofasciculus baicalensis BBK-W-15]